MNDLQKLSLAVANDFVGLKEATGHNDGPFLKYLQHYVARTMGLKLTDLDQEPWCAMFATWAIDQAARLLKITHALPVHCLSQGLYQWAKDNGHLLPHPVPGCMGVLRGGPRGHQHTFLVVDIMGDHVSTIDGNESNSVIRTTHPIAECDWIEIK